MEWWLIEILLVIAFLVSPNNSSKTVCCCPDLRLSLRCDGTTSITGESGLGLRCTAASGTDVKFRCELDAVGDRSAVVSEIYRFSAGENLQETLPLPLVDSQKLQESASTEYTYTAVYGESERAVFQCSANVTLADDSHALVISNTLLLDVHYAPTFSGVAPVNEEVKNINDYEPYRKLACTLPASNPPTQPRWWYSKDSQTTGFVRIDTLSDDRQARLAVDQTDLKGDLYLMTYLHAEDDGYYKCEGVYESEVLENKNSDLKLYQAIGSAQMDMSNPAVDILYQSTPPTFIQLGDTVTFTVQARDSNSTRLTYTWEWEAPDSGNVYTEIDFSDSRFSVSDQGRTLNVIASYDIHKANFKCTVASDAKTQKTDPPFSMPIIQPKFVSIPTGSGCNMVGGDTTAAVNTAYMMSEQLNSEPYKQLLTGSQILWNLRGKVITAINNSGGTTNASLVVIKNEKLSTWNVDDSIRCLYFSRLGKVDPGYQILQTIKVERPSEAEGCETVSVASLEAGTSVNCTADKVTVTLPSSPRCLAVSIRAENGTEMSGRHYFDTTVDSGSQCQSRDLSAILDNPSGLTGTSLVVWLNGEELHSAPTGCDGGNPDEDGGMSGAVVAGIVVGALGAIALAGVAVYLLVGKGSGGKVCHSSLPTAE